MSLLVLVEAHVGEELAGAVVAERGVGEAVAGLGARAGLDLVGVDRDGARRDPRGAGDHPLPAVLDRLDAAVVEPQVRLVVHAVQALHDGLLELVDDLGALARVGVDLVDALVVDLHLEVRSTSSGSSAASEPIVRGSRTPPCRRILCSPRGRHSGYELDGAVATLTLNRPQRLNAIVPELVEDLRGRAGRAEADAAVRVVRLRGAGRAFCAGYDIEWGAEAMEAAEGGRPVGPDGRLPHDVALRRRLHAAVALAEAGDRPGARPLRRRRDRLRAVLGPDRVRGGVPHRLPAGARVGLADHLDVDLPRRAGAREAPAADRRRARRPDGRRVGAGLRGSPEVELEEAGLALARRVALLPANQLQMMKLLVNQAYEQMGLATTQLVGTLLDGAARHTPEGVAFTARRDGRRPHRGGRPRRAVRRLRPGAAMRRALAAAALAAALLAGCGDSGPSAEQQVRTTLDEFGRATAAKDYQALCDRIFAPQLVRKLNRSASRARSRSSRASRRSRTRG